jgi:hypothetical protein
MDAEATWRHIDQQRADLADFLEALTTDQWDTPSLCAGWTVRDVGVHLTQSAASSGDRVSGAMSDILLALAGRNAGLDGLSGPVPTVARR